MTRSSHGIRGHQPNRWNCLRKSTSLDHVAWKEEGRKEEGKGRKERKEEERKGKERKEEGK